MGTIRCTVFTGKNYRMQSLHNAVVLFSNDGDILSVLSSLGAVLVRSIEEIINDRFAFVRAVILDAEFAQEGYISAIRRAHRTCFVATLTPQASECPHFRLQCFNAGANMVAYDIESIVTAISRAVLFLEDSPQTGNLACPYCSLSGLTEKQLWHHCPAYHINWSNETPDVDCPICRKGIKGPLQVHIHENHSPWGMDHNQCNVSRREGLRKGRPTTILYNFSLVLCRHPVTGKFLMCQEFANQGFWLPGGAVDCGESLSCAAVRETLEEAGLAVELKGILAIEYHPCGEYSRNTGDYLVRLRVIFYAEPTAAALSHYPKCCPDFESAGACWCSYSDIALSGLPLRGNEPKKWSKYLLDGGVIHPLSLLIEKDG